MKLRLHSELKKDQILLGLEHLRKHTKFFSKFNKKQLEAFEAHFKFVSFKEKQQLTKRGEPVDYLGFIIKGSAQTLIENVQKQILEEGDCIGFMACLKMQGAEIQQCDIFAKEDGYLAFIKLDDIRLLSKRDSQFTSFIIMQLSLLALDYVSNQFLGKEYTQHNQQQILETASKKIITMLDNLGVVEIVDPKKKKKQIDESDIKTFRHFWNELEQKEKRLFVQYSNLVEINTSEVVARQHDNTQSFYIILQGELVEFKDKTAGKIYKVGEIIGIKEYLTGQSYSSNIYGRGKCLALKVSQSGIQDMIEISGSSVIQIVSMLTRFEAYQLRKSFENQFPELLQNFKSKIENEVEQLKAINKPLTKKEQFTTSQLTNNYFEINVQKIQNHHQNPNLEHEVIAPLYLLDIYKNLVSKRGYQPNEIKDRKDPMFETGLSIFLRDKAHEQRAELLRQKKLQKQQKGKAVQKEDDDELENIPIDPFEQLNNDYYHVLLENEKLHDLVFLLEERIKEMNEQHKQNKEELQKMQTQIRKNELHKELLSLDLARQILMPADKTQRKKTTLYDNVYIQSKLVSSLNCGKQKIQKNSSGCRAYPNIKLDNQMIINLLILKWLMINKRSRIINSHLKEDRLENLAEIILVKEKHCMLTMKYMKENMIMEQGKGVYIYANGDRYEGDFVKNLKHGIGKLVYKDKGEYYGQWENGQRHGEGIFTYVNKDVYSGWWAFGKKEGKGTYVYADTGARLVGDWKENKIVKGKWILPNGTFFEGVFENNKPNNQGTFYFKNGNTVTGNYKQTIIPNDDPDDKKLNIDMKWQSKGYLFQSAVLINSHENF